MQGAAIGEGTCCAHLFVHQQGQPAVWVAEVPVCHCQLSQARPRCSRSSPSVGSRSIGSSSAGSAASTGALQVDPKVGGAPHKLDAGAGRCNHAVLHASRRVQQQCLRHIPPPRLDKHEGVHVAPGPAATAAAGAAGRCWLLRCTLGCRVRGLSRCRGWGLGDACCRLRHITCARPRVSIACPARGMLLCQGRFCCCCALLFSGARGLSGRPLSSASLRCTLALCSLLHHRCGLACWPPSCSCSALWRLHGCCRLSLKAGFRLQWRQLSVRGRLQAVHLQPGALCARQVVERHLAGHIANSHISVVPSARQQGAGQGGQIKAVAGLHTWTGTYGSLSEGHAGMHTACHWQWSRHVSSCTEIRHSRHSRHGRHGRHGRTPTCHSSKLQGDTM